MRGAKKRSSALPSVLFSRASRKLCVCFKYIELGVPAFVAPIANKHKVGLCPIPDIAVGARDFVVASAFCGPGIAGCVGRKPVVAAAETGGGGPVPQRDGGVGEVGLASGGESRVDRGIVRALRSELAGRNMLAVGARRGAKEALAPGGGPVVGY